MVNKMRKIVILILAVLVVFLCVSVSGCDSRSIESQTVMDTTNVTTEPETTTIETKENDSHMDKALVLKIDNTEVDVSWLDNDSVKALKEIAKDGLTVKLHMYGNFEQTGSLGTRITSNDEYINVGPGDIVLYQSNQICLYYDNNSYSFTRLGHINLSKAELVELLGEKDSVTITLSLRQLFGDKNI